MARFDLFGSGNKSVPTLTSDFDMETATLRMNNFIIRTTNDRQVVSFFSNIYRFDAYDSFANRVVKGTKTSWPHSLEVSIFGRTLYACMHRLSRVRLGSIHESWFDSGFTSARVSARGKQVIGERWVCLAHGQKCAPVPRHPVSVLYRPSLNFRQDYIKLAACLSRVPRVKSSQSR